MCSKIPESTLIEHKIKLKRNIIRWQSTKNNLQNWNRVLEPAD